MSYTVQYLESDPATKGFEVSVLVNCLVQDAIGLAASDVHIEPWESSIAVRARVARLGAFRPSGFGLPSVLGFRPSDFRAAPCRGVRAGSPAGDNSGSRWR